MIVTMKVCRYSAPEDCNLMMIDSDPDPQNLENRHIDAKGNVVWTMKTPYRYDITKRVTDLLCHSFVIH